MSSKQKTVLVTGCSAGGIGAALAHAFAKRDHRVFATARDPSKIPETLASLAAVTTICLDVTSGASVAQSVRVVAEATAEEHGGEGLDVLVNNAGRGYTMPLLDADLEVAKQVYDTNVWGTVRAVQAFAPLLVKRGGRVVNVSSVGAVVNTPWIGIYSSSKAALTNLSETLRMELAPLGVSVVTLMVGTIATPFHANEPSLVLPSTSYYTAIKGTIARWASGDAGPKGCSAEDFAESVADEIVGGKKGRLLWKGPNSTAVWFISRWMPASVLDGLMSNGQGLDELAKSAKEPQV